jgi:hypothetical protein
MQNVQDQSLLTCQPIADIRYSVVELTLSAAVRGISEFRIHGLIQRRLIWGESNELRRAAQVSIIQMVRTRKVVQPKLCW